MMEAQIIKKDSALPRLSQCSHHYTEHENDCRSGKGKVFSNGKPVISHYSPRLIV